MAFTQDQLDALDAAYASGERRVQVGDKVVELFDVSEYLKLRGIMLNDIQAQQGKGTTSAAAFYRDPPC